VKKKSALATTPPRWATIDNFKEVGSEHGANCARAMLKAMGVGIRDPKAHWRYFTGFVLPAKAAELRALGASDEAVEVYTKSSMETATSLLDELARELVSEERRIDAIISRAVKPN
jgi:hypothetical protein